MPIPNPRKKTQAPSAQTVQFQSRALSTGFSPPRVFHLQQLRSLFFTIFSFVSVSSFSVFVLFLIMSSKLPGSAFRRQCVKEGWGGVVRLTAAEPAGEARRTWGAEEEAEVAARCPPAGRAAGSAGPVVSAGPAGAPRGLCKGRGPLQGPGWTPGSGGRSTGTGTSSAGQSSFQLPPIAPVPPPSASSILSCSR